MKKVILFVFAVVMAVSCSLDGGGYQKYEIRTTFEYNYQMGVDYEQTFGKDSVYHDTVGKAGAYWQDLLFHQKISDAGQFLGGFALSYLAPSGMGEKKDDYVYNEYKVAGPKLSANQINTYAVYLQNPDATKMPQNSISFLSSQYATCVLKYCYVNNTEAVYYAAKNNFTTGDKFVLTATGYLGSIVTGEASITMASVDSVMYNWTKFDLEKLGIVDKIDFKLSSSNGSFGVPMTFCLDELVAEVETK
jgi:hypothetical protein